MAAKLVVFDMAGTTVDDTVNGLPLVAVAMQEALKKHGIDVSVDEVNKVRGMEKKDAIKTLLSNIQHPDLDQLVEPVFADFKISLNSHLQFINKEIPGTSDVFKKLRSNGVKVAVGSGFPHAVVEAIANNLHWTGMIDYISSAEKEGHGRPHPAMILAAMKHCGIQDIRSVVKVGDTKADVLEGRNAGCRTVAVLTGTQTRQDLESVGPDFIINSIANLFDVLTQIKSPSSTS